jgi:type IV pilus assembly protein PilX
MTNNPISLAHQTRQSGAALVTGLIFLVVLTMIGVTAARMSTLEERMSGNMRDRAIAMQAAELALRDAERDISNTVAASSRNVSGITGFVADCGASTGTIEDDGLCYNGASTWATAGWTASTWTTNLSAAPSVPYGLFTTRTSPTGTTPDSTKAIPVVSAQPRYIIEGIRKLPPGSGSEVIYYRITTRAVGANSNTVVWLQELFRP